MTGRAVGRGWGQDCLLPLYNGGFTNVQISVFSRMSELALSGLRVAWQQGLLSVCSCLHMGALASPHMPALRLLEQFPATHLRFHILKFHFLGPTVSRTGGVWTRLSELFLVEGLPCA